MIGKRLLPLLLLVLAVGLPSYAATRARPAPAPAIAPRATELLGQMSDYMRELQQFRVYVETTREGILPSGQRLDSDQEFTLFAQRPDHLRIDHASAAGERELYYDGKTVTVYTPAKHYYAVAPAPPTIREAIQAAYRRGIDMPLADFLAGHPAQTLTKNATSGIYVGKSLVQGVEANHLAFRQKDIDWQIWIEDTDTPLPVKVAITDRTVKGSPKYTAVMTGWDTTPLFDASTFTFTPPEGARQIQFRQMQAPVRPGMRTPRR